MNLCPTYAGTSSTLLRLNQEQGSSRTKQARSVTQLSWEFSKGTRDRKEVNELMNVTIIDCARSVCAEW